ncbi:MAG TPA: prepilin-type N-terminal cleavage/methylation domain-containing protein [Deltaproteobacteria bacterium]|nr:prepilin-type N-terminal cleavage/methylation domain-containing protein [Deltaproteobacteria bacterium]HPR52341.1 prepilin-type N-terminal cleavage/methylation domain-containing protein [Deltaproteobacteria bacterium]
MNTNKLLSDNRGLTLVELMVVLVLSLLLMAAVYLSYQVQHRESNVQHEVSAIQQDLRAVMDIMERDIRNAGCDPSEPPIGLIGIVSTSGAFPASNETRLGLRMDLDGDGVVSGSDEIVSYIWHHDTRRLERNGQNLAENITNLTLIYTSSGANLTPASGTQLGADAADVRVIDITLQTRSDERDPETGSYLTRTFTRRVKGRNLGL